MGELINFKFFSTSKIDDDTNVIEFNAKGYKKIVNDETIYYFKHEYDYKFIIKKDRLKVNVGLSSYEFDCKKDTKALIKSEEYCSSIKIITKKLNIKDNRIEIDYLLDFINFKGEYHIILELL